MSLPLASSSPGAHTMVSHVHTQAGTGASTLRGRDELDSSEGLGDPEGLQV